VLQFLIPVNVYVYNIAVPDSLCHLPIIAMSLYFIRYVICGSILVCPVEQCFNLLKPSGNSMCHVLPTQNFCVLLEVLTVNNGYFREEH
jgi:hypothetical protein